MAHGALGGGIWQVQDKIFPGAYINFVTAAKAMASLGARGTVALPMDLDWGPEIQEIEAKDFELNTLGLLGVPYTADSMKNLRETFRGARKVILYRTNHKGKKATATVGGLTVEAKYTGARGNDLKVIVANEVDKEDKFTVITMLGLIEVDEQTVAAIEELKDNAFVTFKGDGALEVTAGTKLEGGSNGEVTGEEISSFLKAIERKAFTTVLYPGEDELVKEIVVNFVTRLRDEEGYKVSGVIFDYAKAHKAKHIVSVKNAASLTYWVAGQSAGANFNESLTNALYDGEYEVNTEYTKTEFDAFLNKGQFVFYGTEDEIRVLQDINTFIEYTPDEGKQLSKNRVMRTLDQIANDVAALFNRHYLAKVDNDPLGRDLFKKDIVTHHRMLQDLRAIQDFEPEDVEIFEGNESDAVVVNDKVKVTDSMEKLYMSVLVA